jgi:hypothetical protein
MPLIIKKELNLKEREVLNNFYGQVESQSPSNSFISLSCEEKAEQVEMVLTINSFVLRTQITAIAPCVLEAIGLLKKDFKELITNWLKTRKL